MVTCLATAGGKHKSHPAGWQVIWAQGMTECYVVCRGDVVNSVVLLGMIVKEVHKKVTSMYGVVGCTVTNTPPTSSPGRFKNSLK